MAQVDPKATVIKQGNDVSLAPKQTVNGLKLSTLWYIAITVKTKLAQYAH